MVFFFMILVLFFRSEGVQEFRSSDDSLFAAGTNFQFSIFNFQFSIRRGLLPPCFQVPLGDLEAVVVAAYIFYTVALELGDALGV